MKMNYPRCHENLEATDDGYAYIYVCEKCARAARDLKDYIPFVYGSHLLKGVAYRYSTQFNENSKTPSYAGHFPEAFHNAVMISEATEGILKKIRVILLRDPIEDNRKKIAGFKELLVAFEEEFRNEIAARLPCRGKMRARLKAPERCFLVRR